MDIMSLYGNTLHSLLILFVILTALLHLVMAAGVAKDLGQLQKTGHSVLIPPFAWVLAVLLSGLWALGIYWLVHHSHLSR